MPWWVLQLHSSPGLLEVKDGGCLLESHLLWLWRSWRGKWASNWIGWRGNLVREPGWLAPLPTTPPQASLYPHAEIMYDSTVMVEIYLYINHIVCAWVERMKRGKKSRFSCQAFGWGQKTQIWIRKNVCLWATYTSIFSSWLIGIIILMADSDTFLTEAVWR